MQIEETPTEIAVEQNIIKEDDIEETNDDVEETIADRIKTNPRMRTKPIIYGTSNYIGIEDKKITYDEKMSNIIATTITRHIFTQTYGIKTGIKKFGEQAVESLRKEIGQIHMREAFKPIRYEEMTSEQKKKAIESLIFIVEKRDGTIKSRFCADGRKQREWMSREDTSSPTASTDGIMVLAAIDAKERRDICTIDIPNAFIQTDQPIEDEKVYMKIGGKLCKILVNMYPEIYANYVKRNKNEITLYVELQKALYGTLTASLHYYNKWVRDIMSIGYELNCYDPCVANKIIRGKQHTLRWHVDDVMMSHEDPEVNKEFIEWIKSKYESNIGLIKEKTGKEHDYLGMKFIYEENGSVKITMRDYVNKIIEEYIEDTGETLPKKNMTTPANQHLFKIRDKGEQLTREQKDIFHTTVAKCLFLCLRARPDIQLAVNFLTTRVKNPDEDDWKKLKRVISYLSGTRDLYLTIRMDDSKTIKWYADASYAVHKDYRSHTGGIMTLGEGAVISRSNKQKLNTKSSTEAELVAADDISNLLMWTKLFMKEQGYDMKVILNQDNRSTKLLLNKGRTSLGKRTRHINIRYFYLHDLIKKGVMSVEYLTTKEMIADYLSKPLSGKLFYHLPDLMMNCESEAKANKE